MIVRTLGEVAKALEAQGVRYLVVGGVAVNAHGYARATRDLDLVIQLGPQNVERALKALAELGFRPTIPEPMEAFADPDKRKEWREQRNMEAFSLNSDRFPLTPVDLLVEEPFDFDEVMKASSRVDLGIGVPVRIVDIQTLIHMKEKVGRPRDLDDIEHLRFLLDSSKPHGRGGQDD